MISLPLRLGDEDELFAMECRPDSGNSDTCVVMLNAGLLDQTGPYRLHVQLSEELARMGLASLRVDLNGKGESAERAARDYAAALDADRLAIERHLAAAGYARAVLMGLCSGAMDAVEMASNTDRFTGLILIDGFARNTPVSTRRYYFRRLLRPSAYWSWLRARLRGGEDVLAGVFDNPWPDPEIQIARYRALLARGIGMLAIYTGLLEWHYNRAGQLAEVLAPCENRGLLAEVLLADADHIFTTVYHRRRVIAEMTTWLKRFA